MKYFYQIYRPAGNDTALVEGIVGDPLTRKLINDKILEKHANVEQVGFLSESGEAQLLMAGGEFCGNASRCAAIHYLSGKLGALDLAVCEGEQSVKVGYDGEMAWSEIPLLGLPEESVRPLAENVYEVKMIGISHLVIERKAEDPKKEALAALSIYQMDNADCLGVIFVEDQRLYPVVLVKKIETLFYETACGSGTMAVALVKYFKEKKAIDLNLEQPSGKWIRATIDEKGIRISGEVVVLGRGEIEL